ncbi:helix-turn-helix domain-containing protein [Streptomyces griseorubiginosus]|uniref:helix-turn-helix domain-containing protein n=1 Tax=Streptomyces griseorubiginosus TaxID=67304 RepID=UPI0033EAEFFE
MVGPSPAGGGPVPSLTDREMELLTRVANGESYPQIAADWVVEQITVRTTGVRVLRKLGANHITHAVFLACRAGLLDGRPQRHGDHAGFAAHERRGEDPWACEACAEGERAYRRDRRAARKGHGA